MAAKPGSLPRWANVGGDIVTPSSGKQDVGWVSQERPPAQYINWLHNLVYQWLDYFNDGALHQTDEANNAPQWSWGDADARVRTYVDRMGFFAGPAINNDIVWNPEADATGSAITNANGGFRFRASSANASYKGNPGKAGSPASNFPYGQLRIESSAAAVTDYCNLGGHLTWFNDIDDLTLVMEWRAALSHVGANEVSVLMGLHSTETPAGGSEADPNTYTFALFEKLTGDTNWQTSVGDGGGGTSNDSGVAPVADTFQTFRLEYHGVSTPLGVTNGFATVRFFINGVEEDEIADANVPSGALTFLPMFRLTSTATGPSADTDLYVSPLHMGWSMELAGAIPA